MPEVDSGSGIALLVMGILYGAGFLIGAWILIRRISRKERQFHDREDSEKLTGSDEPDDK